MLFALPNSVRISKRW